jgi:putative nucleotidyltransferase with HDIG domain
LASKIDVIPSVSPVYLELERLLKSPLACAEEMGSVIARDMGLCAKALQAANSGCFARMQYISDPMDAAGLLGPSGLQKLSVEQAFQEFKPQQAASFNMDRLWRHSLQCSRLARERAGADDETQSQAQVAGLLHDIGKLMMACYLPEQYERAAELSAKEGLSDAEAERRIFQTSHAELGAYVMALWNIPDAIVEAIAYHHAPEAAVNSSHPVLMAVYLAELACRESATE